MGVRTRSAQGLSALVGAASLLALGLSAPGAASSAPGERSLGDGDLLSTTLSAAQPRERSCFRREAGSAAGVDTTTLEAPRFGMIQARLAADDGDWDLALFDADSGQVVAAGASFGASEVAEGYVTEGEDLVLQACRLAGDGTAAAVTADLIPIPHQQLEPSSLVRVRTPRREDKAFLQTLGLDLTEHAAKNFVDVVAHGAEDEQALKKAGLSYEVVVGDLGRQSARQREKDAAYARATTSSSLPSGRDTYRRLFNYDQEMKRLVEQHPDLVRPLELPKQTWEGRTVEGIEITTDSKNIADGKPVFLQLGLHHAREWPSGEHVMEWAYELINGYEHGDERIRRLVQNTRTIFVPVVNPDGFNASREAGELQGGGGGRGGDDLVNIAMHPNEYRRKNCRLAGDPPAGSCSQPSAGLAEPGVDPNRNYGGFWGGPGASTDPTAQDYRGPGPFSEPETQNIRALISHRQVTTMITNHTYSNLVLRPPGLASQGDPVDEPQMKALGDAMAAQNGYLSQHGFDLYDTSGTTEDWSYYSTGGYGYTFEIGCNPPGAGLDNCTGNFHPPFQDVVNHYEGRNAEAQAIGGGGNRAAYMLAQENTADPAQHSELEGEAPPGANLELDKSFKTPTSPVIQDDGTTTDPILLDDHLHSELKVPSDGHFVWNINPSTRPLVAQARGRPADGPPSDPVSFSGDPSTAPPCGDFETTDPGCWNDHPFTIAGGPGIDNDKATIRIEWNTPASDWDMRVFVDSNGDGSSEGETQEVGQSAQGGTSSESTTIVSPEGPDGELQPGNYVVRVINFAAAEPYDGSITFAGPDPFVAPQTEAWTLSCKTRNGGRIARDIVIGRGESQTLDLRGCRGRNASCTGKRATIASTLPGEKLVGTPRDDVIVGGKGRNVIRGRGGNDLVCGGAGNDRLRDTGGNDVLRGGKGKDRAAGGRGNDVLGGGGSADRLDGGGGKDLLSGGAAADKLNGGPGRDRCRGGAGRDRERSCER